MGFRWWSCSFGGRGYFLLGSFLFFFCFLRFRVLVLGPRGERAKARLLHGACSTSVIAHMRWDVFTTDDHFGVDFVDEGES